MMKDTAREFYAIIGELSWERRTGPDGLCARHRAAFPLIHAPAIG
jgi:hypothetical protein